MEGLALGAGGPPWPPGGGRPQTCVTNAKGGVVGDIFRGGAVQEMGDCWPPSVGLRGQALNHPVLRWLKTVVVSDREKARLIASGGDQEDVPGALGVPGVRW